jgi:hypothetical protein
MASFQFFESVKVVLTPLTSEFSFGTDQRYSDSTKTVTPYPTESKQFLNDQGGTSYGVPQGSTLCYPFFLVLCRINN